MSTFISMFTSPPLLLVPNPCSFSSSSPPLLSLFCCCCLPSVPLCFYFISTHHSFPSTLLLFSFSIYLSTSISLHLCLCFLVHSLFCLFVVSYSLSVQSCSFFILLCLLRLPAYLAACLSIYPCVCLPCPAFSFFFSFRCCAASSSMYNVIMTFCRLPHVKPCPCVDVFTLTLLAYSLPTVLPALLVSLAQPTNLLHLLCDFARTFAGPGNSNFPPLHLDIIFHRIYAYHFPTCRPDLPAPVPSTRSSGTAVTLTHPHPTLAFTTCPRRSPTAPLTAVCFHLTDHTFLTI